MKVASFLGPCSVHAVIAAKVYPGAPVIRATVPTGANIRAAAIRNIKAGIVAVMNMPGASMMPDWRGQFSSIGRVENGGP